MAVAPQKSTTLGPAPAGWARSTGLSSAYITREVSARNARRRDSYLWDVRKTSRGRPKEKTMPAYVLIRETRKDRKAPSRGAVAAVAGLGLAGALLAGIAFEPGLAAGLLRFIPVFTPTFG